MRWPSLQCCNCKHHAHGDCGQAWHVSVTCTIGSKAALHTQGPRQVGCAGRMGAGGGETQLISCGRMPSCCSWPWEGGTAAVTNESNKWEQSQRATVTGQSQKRYQRWLPTVAKSSQAMGSNQAHHAVGGSTGSVRRLGFAESAQLCVSLAMEPTSNYWFPGVTRRSPQLCCCGQDAFYQHAHFFISIEEVEGFNSLLCQFVWSNPNTSLPHKPWPSSFQMCGDFGKNPLKRLLFVVVV